MRENGSKRKSLSSLVIITINIILIFVIKSLIHNLSGRSIIIIVVLILIVTKININLEIKFEMKSLTIDIQSQ